MGNRTSLAKNKKQKRKTTRQKKLTSTTTIQRPRLPEERVLSLNIYIHIYGSSRCTRNNGALAPGRLRTSIWTDDDHVNCNCLSGYSVGSLWRLSFRAAGNTEIKPPTKRIKRKDRFENTNDDQAVRKGGSRAMSSVAESVTGPPSRTNSPLAQKSPPPTSPKAGSPALIADSSRVTRSPSLRPRRLDESTEMTYEPRLERDEERRRRLNDRESLARCRRIVVSVSCRWSCCAGSQEDERRILFSEDGFWVLLEFCPFLPLHLLIILSKMAAFLCGAFGFSTFPSIIEADCILFTSHFPSHPQSDPILRPLHLPGTPTTPKKAVAHSVVVVDLRPLSQH